MHLTRDQQSIIALCTPRGSGALALLRLSGIDACSIAAFFSQLSSADDFASCASHTIHHGYVMDSNERVDEVMFLLMRAPRTFTGQDTIEITCHNNPFIIDTIMEIACRYGARRAEAGEFTKRAVLSGKLDLIEAEAIADLIAAPSQQALKASLAQLQGSLSAYCKEIEHDLLQLLSVVEASFEFLDEEQRDLDFEAGIRQQLDTLDKKISNVLTHFHSQQQIREGIRIALIGSTNAGKSTLFNALCGKERALVSEQAGTTRDSIEASVYQEGIFWTFIDTAGLRETADSIEKQGIDRSWKEALSADVIVLVYALCSPDGELDYYKEILGRYKNKTIVVWSKIDQCTTPPLLPFAVDEGVDKVAVCALTSVGVEELKRIIAEKIKGLLETQNSPFLLNKRHHALLSEIQTKLQRVHEECRATIAHELVAYHLREALEIVSELTGKNIQENMLDTIFKDFCVGK